MHNDSLLIGRGIYAKDLWFVSASSPYLDKLFATELPIFYQESEISSLKNFWFLHGTEDLY